MAITSENDNRKGWTLNKINSTGTDSEANVSWDCIVKPPDGGVAAWMFIAGAFVIEAVCWGKLDNDFYSTDIDYFRISRRLWSLCELLPDSARVRRPRHCQLNREYGYGKLLQCVLGLKADIPHQGVSSILNPFLFYFGAKYPGQRGDTMRAGAIICVLSALGAAFSNTVRQVTFPLNNIVL